MYFPGGPVVKAPCFHYRGHGFDSWLGKFCMPFGVAKKKSMYMSISIYKSWRNIQYLNYLETKYSLATDKH